LGRLGVGALVVLPSAFFVSRRDQIAALAIRHAMPTIYIQREFPAAGGLMSYGPSVIAGYRQIGIYAARILKGERPGDLPVQQSTKFEPRHQSQHRQSARPRRSFSPTTAGRRGDRITTLSAAFAHSRFWHETALPSGSHAERPVQGGSNAGC
jgi:hypothetical protein